MGFLNYVLLGGLSYAAGWGCKTYLLEKHTKPQSTSTKPYGLTHPTIMAYLAGFFIIMLIVSALIDQLVLMHSHYDIVFIIVNSLVATFVFSFGLSPDTRKHEIPD